MRVLSGCLAGMISVVSLFGQAAAGGGTTRVARTLLADYSTRFAGDPTIAAADALARQLGS